MVYFSDTSDTVKQQTEDKLKDLIDQIKDIKYAFRDKNNPEKIYDNREWIHNCRDLGRYYRVQTDPRVTLKDKIGICTDQCLAIEYLMKKLYPDMKPCLYALCKGRYGHCVCGFEDDNNFYYLENAWDKMKKDDKPTLYGPFDSESKLRDFFADIYEKAHEKDTDEPVKVMTYYEYMNEGVIMESLIWLK